MGLIPSTYWVRFTIRNPLDQDVVRLLENSAFDMDHYSLYIPTGTGHYKEYQYGAQLPFAQREIQHRYFVHTLVIPAKTSQTYYMRFQSKGAMYIPLVLWEATTFTETAHHEQIILGIFYGVVIVMIIYNAFLGFLIRDKTYLFYVLYLLSFLGFDISYNGLGFQYFWPDQPWWNNYSVSVTAGFVLMGVYLFARSYLNTRKNTPTLDKFLYFLAVICFASTFYSTFGEKHIIFLGLNIMILFGIITIVITAIMGIRMRYRPAYYYAIAWCLLFIGGVPLALANLGFLEPNFITNWGLQIGYSFEVVLLSLGLADRINLIKKEKAIAQAQALKKEKESQRILQESHRQLNLLTSAYTMLTVDMLSARIILRLEIFL